ncbi:MAG: cyanoexosortase B system-associated protein [Cyanobacteria bacterium P01_D01_bin.44]
MQSTARPIQPPQRLLKSLIVAILAILVAVNALPRYFSGQWPWSPAPSVPQIEALRNIRKAGLAIPGWQQVVQETATFGGDTWSVQQFASQPAGAPVVLLLRPQAQASDQPEVEWLDLKGAQKWTMDSSQRMKIEKAATADTSAYQLQANFLRVWNSQQTYAALQWYAWPQGGHPSPSRWFWGDQKAQLQSHQRLPWVAATLLVPIAPLGDSEAARPMIQSLGQQVQTALQAQVFAQPTS